MCVPSLQESYGQTASEALACGTPVVGFAATGLLDIVDHRQNGYLARPFDCGDFAAGIEWVLHETAADGRLSRSAREKAEQEFDVDRVAQLHAALYRELLEGARVGGSLGGGAT
jgi:glycosyltransferase involved in cell wall biosynthesis